MIVGNLDLGSFAHDCILSSGLEARQPHERFLTFVRNGEFHSNVRKR